jgi:hypothetical protein
MVVSALSQEGLRAPLLKKCVSRAHKEFGLGRIVLYCTDSIV